MSRPPVISSVSSHGENKVVSAALFWKKRREGEREEADVRSQGRRGILIGNPRTPRGPRSPDFARISSEKETPIGSLLPDFEFLYFFFGLGLLGWALFGLGFFFWA